MVCNLKIGTFNAQNRLSNDLGWAETVDYFKSKNCDIVLLQEIGLLSNTPDISPQILGPYSLFLNCEGSCAHHSVGILIKSNLRGSVARTDRSFPGRHLSIHFETISRKFCISNVYLPTGIMSVPDRREEKDKKKEKEEKDRHDSLELAKRIASHIQAISREKSIIVGGDFNEILRPCSIG